MFSNWKSVKKDSYKKLDHTKKNAFLLMACKKRESFNLKLNIFSFLANQMKFGL